MEHTMAIDTYEVITLLIVLTAVFSYINFRFIRLPAAIGVMLISLLCSLVIVIVGTFYPSFLKSPVAFIHSLDFETLLMRIMLSFLLFAGAIHIDLQKLKHEMAPIISFSTIGVLISTAVIGGLIFLVFSLFHVTIPFIYCLLFGALISPTDPIAVMGILRQAKIPASLEIRITGESLFNDGVGVVVFATILEIAQAGMDKFSFAEVGWAFLRQAGGGILWGFVLGYLGFYFIRSIDHYQVEVLITVAIVMGGYLLAQYLRVSGPLAMVVAGIITGNKGEQAMSDVTRDYLGKFWELVDEILNVILFLLIGFEVLILSFHTTIFLIGLTAIVIVLLARLVSVYVPTIFLKQRRSFETNMIPILTWGGLRGGLSVAMALSLPASMYRNEFVSITYIVVVFSILVQGLTIGPVARKLVARSKRIETALRDS
jgi:CPA1 family monovalent cation:H+ antiporter